jgi:hypothetical protein
MANFAANAPIFTAHTTSWTTPDNTHIDVSTNDYRNYSRSMGESFAVHQFRRGPMPGILKSGWTNQSAEYHPFSEFPNPSSSYLQNKPFIGVSAMPQAMTQYHPGGGSWAANSNEASVAFDASPYGTSHSVQLLPFVIGRRMCSGLGPRAILCECSGCGCGWHLQKQFDDADTLLYAGRSPSVLCLPIQCEWQRSVWTELAADHHGL